MGHPATVLEGRVIVITGAARGIGRALAERLLAAGARVVLSDRDEEALGRTHKDFAQASSIAVTADVTSGASMAYLAGEAERRLGPIDVWINNAGLARHRAIADYSEDEIDSMLAVNLKGTILGSQAALRTMAPRRRGHIVNISRPPPSEGSPAKRSIAQPSGASAASRRACEKRPHRRTFVCRPFSPAESIRPSGNTPFRDRSCRSTPSCNPARSPTPSSLC